MHPLDLSRSKQNNLCLCEQNKRLSVHKQKLTLVIRRLSVNLEAVKWKLGHADCYSRWEKQSRKAGKLVLTMQSTGSSNSTYLQPSWRLYYVAPVRLNTHHPQWVYNSSSSNAFTDPPRTHIHTNIQTHMHGFLCLIVVTVWKDN